MLWTKRDESSSFRNMTEAIEYELGHFSPAGVPRLGQWRTKPPRVFSAVDRAQSKYRKVYHLLAQAELSRNHRDLRRYAQERIRIADRRRRI